jgi:3-oxoacyl-[acyl-carrier-protein] synthase-1/3-oxoacyl-[acyl-carrier-protein] synthase II
MLTFLRERTGSTVPVIDYRRFTGEFASASAVAAVMALNLLKAGVVPAGLFGGKTEHTLAPTHGSLVIGLGRYLTAYEIVPQ